MNVIPHWNVQKHEQCFRCCVENFLVEEALRRPEKLFDDKVFDAANFRNNPLSY